MAKVIKRIRSTVDCRCGATIEYGPNDVRSGGGTDPYSMDIPEPEYKYITCPDCKKSVHLSSPSKCEDDY